MALDNVKKSLTTGNDLCIWDPSPMCLGSGATTLMDGLVNPENKRAWDRFDFANELHSEDKFYSINNYETCKNWTNASQRARDGNALERNLDPRYKENTRFIIIAAGPTGSGKTKIENAIKNVVARTLNPKASNLPFQNLGHDENIKTDPIFIKQYKKIIPEGVSSNNITQEQISNVFSLYEEYKTNNSKISRIEKEKEAIRLAHFYIQSSESLTEIPQKSVLQEKSGENIPYDTYLYFQVCIAFYLGLNINYETTLKSPDSIKFLTKAAGIFTNGCNRFDYVFILGFPIVELNQLEQRIKNRFNNRGNKVEFLDMLIDNKLLDDMEKSYKFIAGIIENCTGRVDVRTICGKNGKIGIDYLALFDNTKTCVYDEQKAVAMSCDPEIMPQLDVLPISERSYILLKGGRYKNPATRLQLQTPQKQTLIALLMTNLNRAIDFSKQNDPWINRKNRLALSLDCTQVCRESAYCLSPRSQEESCIKSMQFDDRPDDLNKLKKQAQLDRHKELLTMRKKNGGKRKTRRAKKKKGRQTRRKK